MPIMYKFRDVPNRQLPVVTAIQETGNLEQDLHKARMDSEMFKGKIFKGNRMGMHHMGFRPTVVWAKFLADHPGIVEEYGKNEAIARFYHEYPQFRSTNLLHFGKNKIK